MTPFQTSEPSFIEKIKHGFRVVVISLTFIWHHKKLMLFPIFTASVVIGTIGVYEAVYYETCHMHITAFFPKETSSSAKATADKKTSKHNASRKRRTEYSPQFLLFVLITTFAFIFAFAFFHVALSYAATQAFKGTPISIGASLMHSIKRLPTILMWSILAFIIHLLINIITNKEGKSRFAFFQRLLGELLEFAWYITTFLVVPVLAHENSSALASIKKSAELMKKTFGENLVATLLLPQLIGLIMLAWVLLSMGISYVLVSIGDNDTGIWLFFHLALPISGALLIIAIALCVAVSAATTVFKTAAYHYATGSLIGPFSSQEVKGSFVPEDKK